jgi:hypothetical protein
MDLGPRVLAFVWLVTDSPVSGNDGRGWELWLDSRRGGYIQVATGGTGECDYLGLLSPNALGRGAEWLRSTGGCGIHGGPPERGVAIAFDWSAGIASAARPEPFPVALARDGATTWLLRGAGLPSYSFETGQTFSANPRTCASDSSDCILVRATGLPFGPADEQVPCAPCVSRRRSVARR